MTLNVLLKYSYEMKHCAVSSTAELLVFVGKGLGTNAIHSEMRPVY